MKVYIIVKQDKTFGELGLKIYANKEDADADEKDDEYFKYIATEEHEVIE